MIERLAVKVDHAILRQTYKGWKIKTRTINNHEFVYIAEGEITITIEGKMHLCKKNDFIYFYPNQKHSLSAQRPPFALFYAAHFDMDDLPEKKLPLPDISHIPNNYKIKEYLEEFFSAYEKKEYMYKWKMSIALQNILFEVLSQSNSNAAPMNLTRINKVIEHIHKNPYEKFSIESLTKTAEMKKSYFIKTFKSITGKSPIKYVIDLKLEHARDMLLNTDEPIKKIADRKSVV